MVKKEKKLKIVLMMLGMIFLFSANIFALEERNIDNNKEDTSQRPPRNEEPVVQRPKVEYKSEGLRDPFDPLIKDEKPVAKIDEGQPQKPLPALTVQGVIWGTKLPQAIINNKVVRTGDSLEGVDIVSIGKDGVTISFNGVESKLYTSAMGQQIDSSKKGGSNEKQI